MTPFVVCVVVFVPPFAIGSVPDTPVVSGSPVALARLNAGVAFDPPSDNATPPYDTVEFASCAFVMPAVAESCEPRIPAVVLMSVVVIVASVISLDPIVPTDRRPVPLVALTIPPAVSPLSVTVPLEVMPVADAIAPELLT